MIKKVQEEYPKMWGKEIWIANNEKYCSKILYLKQGFRCSYHYHKIKDETFYILKGTIHMIVDGEELMLYPGESIHIEPGVKHSFTGVFDSEILEVSTQHFEDDSYRENKSHKVPDQELIELTHMACAIDLKRDN
ncbi:MAG: cupin domain-containing protein [Candidatus Peribacteraceae bacterium]|nr:cupin domain-containing protein [Candidatus Peribacteraceae bacterium]